MKLEMKKLDLFRVFRIPHKIKGNLESKTKSKWSAVLQKGEGRFKMLPLATALVLFLTMLFGCSKDEVQSQEPEIPAQISASAGNDLNVLVNEQVALNGSGSGNSPDGVLTYNWKFISKPASSTSVLADENSKTPTFTPDVPGKFKLELTVSNNAKALDTVTVAAFNVKTLSGNYENIFPGPNAGVRDFVVTLDTLYVTCEFNKIGEIEYKKIACFDGFDWASLGCGLDEGSIFDMLEFDGDLYVTGTFNEIGCIAANNIARWDGANWSEVDGGLTGSDNPFGHTLKIFNGELYVGGQFTMAGNISANNIAKWDGTEWSAVGAFADGSVRKLQVYKQKLYAGGFFEMVDGVNTGNIASYDGSVWTALGSLTGLEQKATGVVRHMDVLNDKLYISGDFEKNGQTISELITWDGSKFNDFGKAFSLFQNRIRELSVIDDVLYIGGSFTNVVGSQANNILQWDGENWGIMDQGISGSVLSVIKYNDKVYIGGDFKSAGGNNAENISVWTNN